MTITPQTAATIKAITKQHGSWVDAIVAMNDVEATAALMSMKQTLDDFRASCPVCGASMTTIQDHKSLDGKITTLTRCPSCKTTVAICTPNE